MLVWRLWWICPCLGTEELDNRKSWHSHWNSYCFVFQHTERKRSRNSGWYSNSSLNVITTKGFNSRVVFLMKKYISLHFYVALVFVSGRPCRIFTGRKWRATAQRAARASRTATSWWRRRSTGTCLASRASTVNWTWTTSWRVLFVTAMFIVKKTITGELSLWAGKWLY